jgi:hypothetical protein
MSKVQVHYKKLRTIVRAFYHMRQLCNLIGSLNACFYYGSLQGIVELLSIDVNKHYDNKIAEEDLKANSTNERNSNLLNDKHAKNFNKL